VTTPPPPDGSNVRTADLVHDRFDEDVEVEENDRSKMSFLEHLEELRRRIIYSLYAILACLAATFFYMDRMNTYMLRYFTQTAGDGKIKLLATQLTDAFMFEFKIALLAATIMAAPFVFMQLWLFVAPGLYAKEKKIVAPFVASATVLFGAGVWFAHVIAFPTMVKFFVGFMNEYLTIMPSLTLVFSFYVKMVLGLGLIFELPMLVFFLARFGIVTAGFLLKHTKYAILIIFIVAAVITPSPDPVNQCIFAAPMLLLYGLSIGVAWMFGKKRTETT
jgi:sec-independent protein translocase protein TatC